MKKLIIICLSAVLCLVVGGSILAKDSKKDKIRQNNPVVEALWCRQSPMSFTAADQFKKGEDPDLDRFLCWAAVGVNGVKYTADGTPTTNKKLTIPTAMNTQLITVYAVKEDGVYKYDPDNDELVLVENMEGDYRPFAAFQAPYTTNPLNLIFVADISKLPAEGRDGGPFYPNRDEYVYTAAISVGCAAENVYLYIASTKGRLGAHYYTAMDKELWHEYLDLPPLYDEEGNYTVPDKLVMGAMTIGYPGYPIKCSCPAE